MSADDGADGHGTDGVDARRRRLLALLSAPDDPGGALRSNGTGSDGAGSDGAGSDGAGSDGTSSDGTGGDRTRLGRVCAVAVFEVGVSGAGITVMAGLAGALAGDRDQVWATSALTRRLEGLQLTTGEGPCLDSYADGAPVLVGDLSSEATRWLGFGPEALSVGVAAVFSFPLQVGAVRLGTLDLHRDAIGVLTRDQFADAVTLASVATEILLDLTGNGARWAPEADDRDGPEEDTVGWLPGVHAEVHQASGMVSGRERIGVDAALLRIRAYAYSHGEPIEQVARRILDRTLTLDEHRVDEPDVIPDQNPGVGQNPDDGPAGPDVETDR